MAKKEADSKAVKSKGSAKKAEKVKNQKAKKGGIKKYFRDLKSEIKKVVWPSRKQVVNNTGIVLTVMVIMGLFLFGVDTGLAAAINALLSIGS